MKLFQLMFKRETLVPMLALSFASIVSVVLVIGRMIWVHDTHFAFLIWNLFLAWIPMVFALLAREHHKAGANPGWRPPAGTRRPGSPGTRRACARSSRPTRRSAA